MKRVKSLVTSVTKAIDDKVISKITCKMSQSCVVPKNKKSDQASHTDLVLLKLKTAQAKLFALRKHLIKNAEKYEEEAKLHIAESRKDRALFAIERQKIYQKQLADLDANYALIQKSILDLESVIETQTFTDLLKQTNELIKQIESPEQIEQIQQLVIDMKERDQRTAELNSYFEAANSEDKNISRMYSHFETQIVKEKIDVINKQEVVASVKLQDPTYEYLIAASDDDNDAPRLQLASS